LGLPSLAIGLLVVGTTAWVTGAMHYDGLADSLDGLWGGWSPKQRLDIMKDSHIGVYGVVGLTCILGLQATLYGQLAAQSLWPILGVMALSRAMMVPLMTALPNARGTGLSASVGRPAPQTASLALALGAAVAALSGAWPALIGAPLGAWAVAAIAKRKIGGQTGDILGACQQCAETCALICLVAFL
jgi:adenosylcobinamide-GDP ribazoletransferase